MRVCVQGTLRSFPTRPGWALGARPVGAVAGSSSSTPGPQLSPSSRFPVELSHPGPGLSPEISLLNLNRSHTLRHPPPPAVPSPRTAPPPASAGKSARLGALGVGVEGAQLDPPWTWGLGPQGRVPEAKENWPRVTLRSRDPRALRGEGVGERTSRSGGLALGLPER